MNITLSADEKLIRKAREYAKQHNSSLNNLVRRYLEKITNEKNGEDAAQEFEVLCRENPGESAPGYRFDRSEEYKRR